MRMFEVALGGTNLYVDRAGSQHLGFPLVQDSGNVSCWTRGVSITFLPVFSTGVLMATSMATYSPCMDI
jgi:hypothetical protein